MFYFMYVFYQFCVLRTLSILCCRIFFDAGAVQAKYKTTSLTMNVCENNRRVEINYVESTVQVFFDAKGPCGNGKTGEHKQKITKKNLISIIPKFWSTRTKHK